MDTLGSLDLEKIMDVLGMEETPEKSAEFLRNVFDGKAEEIAKGCLTVFAQNKSEEGVAYWRRVCFLLAPPIHIVN